MRLRYTLPALADLQSILEYVQQHSPQGARSIQARIKLVADLLLRHPRVGVQTADPAIRRINTAPYPYLIFYEVAGEEIIVHAIRHGSRNPAGMPGLEE
jgi:plasmid stabilization system protein ParE